MALWISIFFCVTATYVHMYGTNSANTSSTTIDKSAKPNKMKYRNKIQNTCNHIVDTTILIIINYVNTTLNLNNTNHLTTNAKYHST